MRKHFFMLLFWVCCGCCHSQLIPLEEGRGIYFLSVERTSPLSCLIKRTGRNQWPSIPLDHDPEWRGYFRELKIPESQVEAELKDFFFRHDINTFWFGSAIPCDELSVIIRDSFTANGWKVKRKKLFLEEAYCSWQWIRVFEKGKAQIHVQIAGMTRAMAKMSQIEKDGNWSENRLSFKFRNCSPRSFFPREVESLLDADYPGWSSIDEGREINSR